MDSEKDEKPRNSADVAEEEGLRDLFGSSSDDDSSHKLEESQVVTRVRVLDPEVVAAIEDAKVDSDEDEEERAVKPVGPPLVLKAPIIQKPDKTTLKLVKMSNFVTVEPTPFNAADYQKVDVEKEGFGDQAVMRWRVNESGDQESNSRFVRWDNGSLSLLVGDECFDVDERGVDNIYLYARHDEVMQGLGGISQKYIFRPAEVRKRRVKAMVQSKGASGLGVKVQKITTLNDPIKEKEEKTRREEERIKGRENLAKKQKKVMQKYYIPQPAPLGGEPMNETPIEQRYRSIPRRETPKKTTRLRDEVEYKRPSKRQRDDFIQEDGDEEDDGNDEVVKEPIWNDEEGTEASDDEKPIVSQPSTHQDGRSTQKQSHGGRVIDDDGESSDDGIIRSSKRKISKGRALILADEDDDDDY